MGRPITRAVDFEDCYGCGQQNNFGLKMTFEEVEKGLVESVFFAAAQLRGPPGVIHGGVQATLLDEVMGMAIESALGGGSRKRVTASFALRYQAAAPTGARIIARGRFERSEKRSHFVTGELRSVSGALYTRAEARWVELES